MKCAVFLCLGLLSHSLIAEQVGPWNLDALKSQVPAMKWLRQDQPVHSLIYTGEKYQGLDTEVFAFYASPRTLGMAKEGQTFPGVVCIHGGGGTAFAEWVYLWAKRGYAAIAMDLNGSQPPDPILDANGAVKGNAHDQASRKRLPQGGPPHGHAEKFDSIGGDTSDDWPFHAAASVIRAHTLLRSFAEVQAENTAVTGISWGGFTTCLVASLDDRFKAAVPVYGCGFLHEGESVQKRSIDLLGERRMDWVRAYDPGSLLPRCRVPILFVNGTHDIHYPLDSYMKSYAVVPGEKHLRIQLKMRHGHPPGWAPEEIGLFIDSKCRGGRPLPVAGKPLLQGDKVLLSCLLPPGARLKESTLLYTVETGPRSGREWVTVAASLGELKPAAQSPHQQVCEITAPRPPKEANTWFLTLTDDRDAMVSSEVMFAPAPESPEPKQ
jgi:cephalosporin-C deacetylase-like acetyl esterase